MVKIVKAEKRHVVLLADKLRAADVRELERGTGDTAYNVLKGSFESSELCFTALFDGEVEAMFGVSTTGIMGGVGSPWLLMSDEPTKHKEIFHRVAGPALKVLQTGFSKLENWVDAENEVAIRWLKKLGFVFDKDPSPYGVKGDLFYRFEWRREQCVME